MNSVLPGIVFQDFSTRISCERLLLCARGLSVMRPAHDAMLQSAQAGLETAGFRLPRGKARQSTLASAFITAIVSC